MSLPPIVAAKRLEFSRLFGETSALYRRCLGPLLALGAASALFAGGTALAVVWLYATPLMTALVTFNAAGLASGAMLAAAAAGLASMLVTVQCGAMIAQVAVQVADGRPSDLRAAWRETTTVVPRLLLPCVVLSAATCLIGAAGLTVVLNTLRAVGMSARTDRTTAISAILALMGGLALALAAAGAVTWWLRVKLFLLLPAASLEKLPGFAPVKRSWLLTRGIAGLVFGALVVVTLVEGAVVGFGGQAASVLVTPSLAGGDFGGLVTLVSQLMPAIAVATAISAAVTTFTWPFLTVMSTLVHRALTGYRLTPLISG
ncbi:MAG: hypothetical protein ACOH1Y_15285 [Propionicimonas sp.]